MLNTVAHLSPSHCGHAEDNPNEQVNRHTLSPGDCLFLQLTHFSGGGRFFSLFASLRIFIILDTIFFLLYSANIVFRCVVFLKFVSLECTHFMFEKKK